MSQQYTDVMGCVRVVDVHVDAQGVRVERDLLTRQGRKHWKRRADAIRQRVANTNTNTED